MKEANMQVLALILAGGLGQSLSVFTQQRAKPALPFAGKYRLIDFPLSNLVNSSLFQIAVLTQYKSASLVEHLGNGEPWGLDQKGLQIWQPALGRTVSEKYLGTADAVHQNRKYITEAGCDTLLILSGDQIYKQDYRELLRFHQEKGADLTISSTQVPVEECQRFGMMQVDPEARITSFVEKPPQTRDTLASMGIYVFKTDYLLRLLEQDALNTASYHDFGRDIIPQVTQRGQAYAFPFKGYWADTGDVEAYWKNSMDLLQDPSPLALHDPGWVIHTRSAELPPLVVKFPGKIVNSLVSDGCVIHGEVSHSVLSPRVRVEAGATIRDSVIMNDALIRSGAILDRVVVDKEVTIGANARIGSGNDNTPNQDEPKVLQAGITVIGKHANLPDGVVIGRNCRVDIDVSSVDFDRTVIPAGATVHHR
jgi:glucose-1-phosphate adenylyltransferase